MRGDRETGRDQEAAEVEGVPRVCVRAARRQPVVLDDVARGPRPDQHPNQRDSGAYRQRERSRIRGGGEVQIHSREEEPERQSETLRQERVAQSASSLSSWRAMTRRWISEVPSPISQILASRIIRSTG